MFARLLPARELSARDRETGPQWPGLCHLPDLRVVVFDTSACRARIGTGQNASDDRKRETLPRALSRRVRTWRMMRAVVSVAGRSALNGFDENLRVSCSFIGGPPFGCGN